MKASKIILACAGCLAVFGLYLTARTSQAQEKPLISPSYVLAKTIELPPTAPENALPAIDPPPVQDLTARPAELPPPTSPHTAEVLVPSPETLKVREAVSPSSTISVAKPSVSTIVWNEALLVLCPQPGKQGRTRNRSCLGVTKSLFG